MTKLSCFCLCLLAPAAGAATLVDRGEEIFRKALAYTVQIKNSVSVPFAGDAKGSSLGAGFVIDAQRGWILTNAHVVSRSPSRVEIAFHDQEFHDATKVWVDPYMDIAVVKASPQVDTAAIDVPRLECRDAPSVGHPVGAFGHPWRLQFTGTRGIISGVTSRYRTELLQTDAPINQGNSGGPLISLEDGRIVGINTAGIRGAQNTNFAVAMKYACRIVELLRAGTDPSPPDLGLVFFRDIDNRKLLRVARSYPRPGKLEFRPGDTIQEVIGEAGRIENETQLMHALRGRLEGSRIRVLREGATIELNGTKAALPRVLEQRGVYASGVLFGPVTIRDAQEIGVRGFMVHHVEPGSIGEAQEVVRADVLEAVDGAPIGDLEALHRRLQEAADARRRVELTLKRLVGGEYTFAYAQRRLFVRDLRMVAEPSSADGSPGRLDLKAAH
ncbi:MAG: trypsin-like peptidase domain-containing protein [Burkholderiales bacterium]|nr:trypsin-like peptidase domain-containing protein [Burkholderiales bacterium]